MSEKKYNIEFSPSSSKYLKKLNKVTQNLLIKKIENLQDNPLPNGAKKLSASVGIYRIRVLDYRIIYSINNFKLEVLVIKIGHRSDVYKRLE